MITISKHTVLSVLKHLLVWWMVAGILTETVGVLFRMSSVATVIWNLLRIASFAILVVLPAVRAYKADNPKMRKVQALQSGFNILSSETDEPDIETIPKETIVLQRSYTSDINACMGNSPYLWQWTYPAGISRVTIFSADDSYGDRGAGTLVVKSGRVEQIQAKMQNGEHKVFVNMPLIEASKAARMQIDAPVDTFMKGSIPDANWFWEDAAANTIRVSSAKRGFKNCLATLKRREDGSISSINVKISAEQTKRVFAKKDQSNAVVALHVTKPSQKARRAPKANIQGRTSVSATKSTIVAPEVSTPPVDVLQAETAENLLKPTDIPPVDDERLIQAARLVADDDAIELNDLAMAAEENGDDSFVKKWPEGLQTMKEVEYYCDAILKNGVFARADVNAENETIRFFINVEQHSD